MTSHETSGGAAAEEAENEVVMEGEDDDDVDVEADAGGAEAEAEDDETGSSMSDKENEDPAAVPVPAPVVIKTKKPKPAPLSVNKRHAQSDAKKKSPIRSFQKARLRHAVYRANYEVAMRREPVWVSADKKKTNLYTRSTNIKPFKIPGQLYPMMNLIVSAITTNLLCKTAEITKYRRSQTINAKDVACALQVTRRSKLV